MAAGDINYFHTWINVSKFSVSSFLVIFPPQLQEVSTQMCTKSVLSLGLERSAFRFWVSLSLSLWFWYLVLGILLLCSTLKFSTLPSQLRKNAWLCLSSFFLHPSLEPPSGYQAEEVVGLTLFVDHWWLPFWQVLSHYGFNVYFWLLVILTIYMSSL